ncbi:MAG: class I SAM-dependent methyltransferase [Candidatus Woesearchaeota archaeon]
MRLFAKDWDRHVEATRQLAQTRGFRRMRDRILTRARLGPRDRVIDVGAGTGLLALGIAPTVREVRAVDISPAMTGYLRRQATELGLENVETITATAVDLPVADSSATVVVSNYVYHHLSDADKENGIAEAFRVLRPGGRLVVGDMMFRPALGDERSRRIIGAKVMALVRRGPAGIWRLIKNALRYLTGSWEQPADPEWWRQALQRAGFEQIEVQPLEHEGGIISAVKPGLSAAQPG